MIPLTRGDVRYPDQPDIAYHMPYLESIATDCSVIIEIGCGHGNGSTRAFERGMRNGVMPVALISVDLDPQRPQVQPRLSWWHKVTGDSRDPEVRDKVRDLVRSLCWQYESINAVDLIFIDTDHTYDQLMAELLLWRPLANSRTVWLFHDTWMFGVYNRMTDAILDFCTRFPEWEYVEITRESHGLGMMRWKQRAPDGSMIVEVPAVK